MRASGQVPRSVTARAPLAALWLGVASLLLTGCGGSPGAGAMSSVRPTSSASSGSTPAQQESATAIFPSAPSTEPALDVNPFSGKSLYVWPQNAAAVALPTVKGADRKLLARLAATPTAVWVTPETAPEGEAGTFVGDIVAEAGQSGQVPVFVIYGIPHRDCTGGHSAGGLDTASYSTWIGEIADSLGDGAVVVLEPDALASAPQCGLVSERETELSGAVGQLSRHAVVYLDAGHAGWVAGSEMAAMLAASGLSQTRGFAVNVSGYDPDDSERVYAESVRSSLGGQGHYIIDSSRNGGDSTTEWCNPDGRALGATPGVVDDGSALDARLWVKPPWESDGMCGGGPEAGHLWIKRVLSLARAANW